MFFFNSDECYAPTDTEPDSDEEKDPENNDGKVRPVVIRHSTSDEADAENLESKPPVYSKKSFFFFSVVA